MTATISLEVPGETKDRQPYLASELAKAFELSQIGKYHTKGGTGFSGEDANVFADRIRFSSVEVTGTTNELNGADRVVNGAAIQTKYFPTAKATLDAAFDSMTGTYRYKGQSLEVPKEQYGACVKLMEEKIASGKVPGVVDPQEGGQIVKQGDVTYRQARNIARAGNVDSLIFDAKTQAVTTAYLFSLTFAIQFAQQKWNGISTENAIKGALKQALLAGGTAFVAGLISAQILRTRAAAVGVVTLREGVRGIATFTGGRKIIECLAQASLGKAVYGAAAVNHVSKLLRSNLVTSTVITVVTSTPDFYRAAFDRSISWGQFTKNVVVNVGGVAGGTGGWMGGAAVGAMLGSVIPVLGTAAGGVAGGIFGALVGGWVGTVATQTTMNVFMEDDAVHMVALLKSVLEELATDYMLSEQEIDRLIDTAKPTITPSWLRTMYRAGASTDSDADRRAFAYQAFEHVCLSIVHKRPMILLPPITEVDKEISGLISVEDSVSE